MDAPEMRIPPGGAGAAGPRRQLAQPATLPGHLGRVVAVIDQQYCSVAAVRHAVRLAAGRRQPLEVAFLQSYPSPLAAVGTVGLLAVGAVVKLADEMENIVFGTVASIIAPAGLSWTFLAMPHHAVKVVLPRASAATLVVARHSRRPLPAGRLVATAKVAARSAAGPDGGCDATLFVVGCDHRPDSSVATAAMRSPLPGTARRSQPAPRRSTPSAG